MSTKVTWLLRYNVKVSKTHKIKCCGQVGSSRTSLFLAATHLSKLRQHWNAVPALQFKQIIHILGALYLAENAEVLKCQLNCHFNCIELQEMHLTFTHKLRCHFIRYQCFRCTVRLQVISVAMFSSIRNSVILTGLKSSV